MLLHTVLLLQRRESLTRRSGEVFSFFLSVFHVDRAVASRLVFVAVAMECD